MDSGSSSSSSSSSGGLKFGKKIYFEGVGSGLLPEDGRSPAKKGRSAVEPPRCQVEGCKVDLSDAKSYYCRHKVCGMHSKYPKVIVAGIEQRFCQQCSRFHQLSEFDQGKRSCRRRLAGHNERRRKPPTSPLMSSRYATFSPSTFVTDSGSKPAGFLMDFSSYPTFSGRDPWPNTSIPTKNEAQLPWQSSSQTPYSCPHELSSEDCFNGVPTSRSALSLLSNANASNFLGTSPAAAEFPSWDFKAEMPPPDMGFSQPSNRGRLDSGRYHEFELSGDYESSVQHINWSL